MLDRTMVVFAVVACAVAAASPARGGAASCPFSEDCESGTLASCWTTNPTAGGGIRVTTIETPYQGYYHLTMDSCGSYALNELTLTIDLAGQTGVGCTSTTAGSATRHMRCRLRSPRPASRTTRRS